MLVTDVRQDGIILSCMKAAWLVCIYAFWAAEQVGWVVNCTSTVGAGVGS